MASKPPNRVDHVMETHIKPTYMILITGFYIVYILIFLGVTYIAPQYIRLISNFIYVFLAVILIIKFNPLKSTHTIAPYDGSLIFGAAIFILINVGVTEFAMSFFDSVKTLFNVDINPII